MLSFLPQNSRTMKREAFSDETWKEKDLNLILGCGGQVAA